MYKLPALAVNTKRKRKDLVKVSAVYEISSLRKI